MNTQDPPQPKLYFADTKFSDVPIISLLKYIDLNALSGTIPTEIGLLTGLTSLSLCK